MSFTFIIPNCSCCGCLYTIYQSGTTPYPTEAGAQTRFDDRTAGCVLSAGAAVGDNSRNYLTANIAADVLSIGDSINAAGNGVINYEEDFEVTITTAGIDLACALGVNQSMDLTVDATLSETDGSFVTDDALTPTTGTALSGTLSLVPPANGTYIVTVSMGISTFGPPPAGLVSTANVVASSTGDITYCPIQVAYTGGFITCSLP